jgi:hypothetical protein
MQDYDYDGDHRWTLVEMLGVAEYLSSYLEYTPDDMFEKNCRLIALAEEAGLKGCFLRFCSTYSGPNVFCSLGAVRVVACGYRELNEK